MRVMFISHASDLYGAPKSLLDLIDGLLLKRVQCSMVLPGKGPLIEELRKRNIKFYVIPFRNWIAVHKTRLQKLIARNSLSLIGSMRIALKALSWKADILYTNSSVIYVGALAARLARKPHVWHVREFGEEDFGFFFQLGNAWSMRTIGRLSIRVLTVSEALKRKYRKHIPGDKLLAIHDAVAIPSHYADAWKERAKPDKRRIPVLTIVGRLQQSKGQMQAVLAVAHLIKHGLEVKLKIVGDGRPKYIEELRQAIAENGLDDYVELTGHMSDPIRVMNASDAVLVCSHSEAFGRVTIESMLSGTPVIGARSGATPELIREGINGLLYESGNHIDLAERIRYLLEHPKQAAMMGAAGCRWASAEFTAEKYAASVYSVLLESLSRKQSYSGASP